MYVLKYILYSIYNGLIDNIYRFKLQGVIFPTALVAGGIGLSLLYNKLNPFFNKMNIKNSSSYYAVNKVFHFYDNVIDFIPEIFNPLSQIPQIDGNTPILKKTREDIQLLIINTSSFK